MRIYILPILIGLGLILSFNFCKKEESNIALKSTTPILDPSYNYVHTSRFQGQVNPNEPLDNVLTNAKVALGRVLFYDPRLSKTNTVSCASCHKQNFGFADNLPKSIGFNGQLTKRNSMPIINERFNFSFFWDARTRKLEEQVLMPVADHIEMGMEDLNKLEAKLEAVNFYKPLFYDAFGYSKPTLDHIAKALAQFIRAIPSENSKFDQAIGLGFSNFNAQEVFGMTLFREKANCNSCHTIIHSLVTFNKTTLLPTNFLVNGAMTGSGYVSSLSFGGTNIGLDKVSSDLGMGSGKFKIPSLRNLDLTAPYMHDGRFATLMEVINHYDSGIQNNEHLDDRLTTNNKPQHLNLLPHEKEALIAFLKTLTDYTIVQDKKFRTPFY